MNDETLIQWLLGGDISVQYQVRRDLLGDTRPDLRQRISSEGWGSRFLAAQSEDGHWGGGFYRLKWISTHYTLLDLRHLCLPQNHPAPRKAIRLILRDHVGRDGGVNPAQTIEEADLCINGMFLNYGCYFGVAADSLTSIVDFVLSQLMPDGGFNCQLNRQGAVHSSLHTTISMLEGIHEYVCRGYSYRLQELLEAAESSREFILQHQLFRSDHTGEIIDKRYLMLSYPSRWRYDILRALDYFRAAGCPYDPRMRPALEVLLKKRRKDGTWPVQSKHPGRVHFDMERTGSPSRWNTLRALRVLRHFGASMDLA